MDNSNNNDEAATTSTTPGFQKLSDSMCAANYSASLKCLEEAKYDKSQCQAQFDAYKQCRKRERELRLERNRASGPDFMKILEKLKF